MPSGRHGGSREYTGICLLPVTKGFSTKLDQGPKHLPRNDKASLRECGIISLSSRTRKVGERICSVFGRGGLRSLSIPQDETTLRISSTTNDSQTPCIESKKRPPTPRHLCRFDRQDPIVIHHVFFRPRRAEKPSNICMPIANCKVQGRPAVKASEIKICTRPRQTLDGPHVAVSGC